MPAKRPRPIGGDYSGPLLFTTPPCTMSSLPAPRRFVTSHDARGQSIIQFEGEIPQTEVLEKSGRKARFAVRICRFSKPR